MITLSPAEGFVPFERAAVEQSIPQRFARQVAADPDRLAVKFGPDALTYSELDRWASRVARAVLARGVRSDAVALVIDQGLPLIAGVLGTLKAGRVYVPLEAALGRERLAYMLRDSGARTALVSDAAAPLVREAGGGDVDVLSIGDVELGQSSEAPDVEISPNAPAYIYYTTGSTGQPKGVVDSHRNVLHNVMR